MEPSDVERVIKGLRFGNDVSKGTGHDSLALRGVQR
jgi:hypothetical protein